MIHNEYYTADGQHWKGAPHTDTIKTIDSIPPFHKKLYDSVMDAEEYEDTILANCGLYFLDLFEKNDQVRVRVYEDD